MCYPPLCAITAASADCSIGRFECTFVLCVFNRVRTSPNQLGTQFHPFPTVKEPLTKETLTIIRHMNLTSRKIRQTTLLCSQERFEANI